MTATVSPTLIQISPTASEQLRPIMAQQADPATGLRVWVQSGGCGCAGGVTYGMGLDDRATDDTVLQSDGITIIVDPGSASLLHGAVIDFVDYGARGRGFMIHTADSAPAGGCGSGCGCGA